MRSNQPQVMGEVVELLPSAQYRVQIRNEFGEEKYRMIRCYASGKMQINRIKIILGDRVMVVVSGELGRITRRL